MTQGRALLVIDLQTTMFDGVECPPIHNAEVLIANTKAIIAWARKTGIPTAFIQHEEDSGAMQRGAPGWHVLAALGQDTDREPTFSKSVPDAFSNAKLAEWLGENKQLVLVGAQSDCCVEATTLGALERSYDVTVVADAHSTWLWEEGKAVDATPLIQCKNESFAAAGAKLVSTADLIA
ncbi:isochorismatase hydrolase [Achlya hypogyna]|uniref:Isochorismatase hydrolase n=1 Tax=Achlya hypogyna TaxID=1202772 RepID=A0A1V9YNB4_ACHHY|nr:isochorismatase hydrolase [Achlya hypogyna]